MIYKIIPFQANVSSGSSSGTVANQLQVVVDQMSDQGWDYQGMEAISTFVQGSSGCFGIGAKPGHEVSVQVLVFYKKVI